MEGEPSQKNNSKEEAWKREAQNIDWVVDRLGRHVDPGIKEAVLALHLLGLETDASCEGHSDRGIRAPYIDVCHIPTELAERMKKDLKEMGKYDEATLRDMLGLREKIRRQLEQLMGLLDEFYKGRSETPLARRLVLKMRPNGARLYSQSAELQEYYSPEVQAKRLDDFREEMDAFRDFLKRKFFLAD